MWIPCEAGNYNSNMCTTTPSHCERASVAPGQLGYIKCSISKQVMSKCDAKIRHVKRNFTVILYRFTIAYLTNVRLTYLFIIQCFETKIYPIIHSTVRRIVSRL